ncbi:ANTAR domain-containing protein [Rhodococcus fascians]|nr:ANTAR domain-containing protein [Rhodococcus fascians]
MSEFPVEDKPLRPTSEVPDSAFDRIGHYTQALRRIKSKILTGVDIDVVLQAVCSEVAAVVPDADLVGITMLDESGRPRTVASTDSVVHDIDSDQYRTGQGPCLEAMRSGHMVRAQAREAATRWPLFAAAVADLGVHSYLAAPLTPDEHRHGSLNIYSSSTDGFDHLDEVSVALFATSIETAVAISERTRSAEEELTGLRTAMRTRADIDQAKGIIMAMRGISADEAFALLSEQSQNRNIKVSDIAAAMIDSVAEQTPTDITDTHLEHNSERSTSFRSRSKPGYPKE